MRIPPLRMRLATKRKTTCKRDILRIMQDLEPGLTGTDAAKSYDRVTAAINAWLNAVTRHLPKDLHVRLMLVDCFSVNFCWLTGKPGEYPDYPSSWIRLTMPKQSIGPRDHIARLRCAEYHAWVARGRR